MAGPVHGSGKHTNVFTDDGEDVTVRVERSALMGPWLRLEYGDGYSIDVQGEPNFASQLADAATEWATAWEEHPAGEVWIAPKETDR